MLEEIVDLAAGLFVGDTASFFRPRQRRLVTRQTADFEAGNEVVILALLRDLSQPEPELVYGELVLSQGNARWVLPGQPAEDFVDLDPTRTTVRRLRQMSKKEDQSLGSRSTMLYLDVAGDRFDLVIHAYERSLVGMVLALPQSTKSSKTTAATE